MGKIEEQVLAVVEMMRSPAQGAPPKKPLWQERSYNHTPEAARGRMGTYQLDRLIPRSDIRVGDTYRTTSDTDKLLERIGAYRTVLAPSSTILYGARSATTATTTTPGRYVPATHTPVQEYAQTTYAETQ